MSLKNCSTNKALFALLSLLTLVFLLLGCTSTSGNKQHNSNTATNSSVETSSAVTIGRYSDSSHQGSKVDIKYPIFEGKEEVSTFVKDCAINYVNEFYGADYVDLTANLNFQVSCSDSTIISVIFRGNGNVRTAAHPNHLFFAVNINPQTIKQIKFSDKYQMNSALINTFYRRAQEQVPAEIYSYLVQNRTWIEKYLYSIDDPASGSYSYYTAQGIGVSVPTTYAIGDHIEVELTRGDLSQD